MKSALLNLTEAYHFELNGKAQAQCDVVLMQSQYVSLRSAIQEHPLPEEGNVLFYALKCIRSLNVL